MRITNNMMISNMMRNLNRNMMRLDKRQMQAATGKRISKPSDDPIAVSRSLKIRADISQLNQYNKNVDDATSWLETTELAAKNANEAVHRLRELMVQAANGVLTTEETTKIQEEVKEIKAQLISLGNSSYGSSYIFSGKKTNQALLDAQGNYLVDLIDYKDPAYVDDRQNIQVGNYENIGVNTLGMEIFEAVEKPVVYSEDLGEPPLASGSEIKLQLEGGKSATVRLKLGGAEGVNINQQGTEGVVTLPIGATEEEKTQAILSTFKKMGKEYGSPLKDYDFSKSEANELNGTNVKSVLRIKATPKDAIAVDTREASAVWETGAITTLPKTEDFVDGKAVTFSFMGISINIERGATGGGNFKLDDDSISKAGATIIVDDAVDLTTITSKEYVLEIQNAFKKISQEDGSKIADFTFEALKFNGDAAGGDGSGGLRVIAPEKSGTTYNKEVFGGTLDITNKDIASQQVIAGESEKRTVAKGQKAGLIEFIDNIEKDLLEGNTEEISNKLGMIDKFHQNLLKVKSEVGAKVNRMDLIKERVADNTINFRDLQSQLEDADMGEVLMELINEENVYRSSLSIGARIIQPTLLDFLR